MARSQTFDMDQLFSFWLWWGLACVGWVWMIASDLKDGWLGWSFLRIERDKDPKKFWAFFVAQNAVVLVILVWLASERL